MVSWFFLALGPYPNVAKVEDAADPRRIVCTTLGFIDFADPTPSSKIALGRGGPYGAVNLARLESTDTGCLILDGA